MQKTGEIFQTFGSAKQLEEILQAIHQDPMEFKLCHAGFDTATT